MAGLDKIIARIQAESEEAAARTLEAAKAEAETILQNAREEADAECAAIGRKAEQAATNILDRGHSAAELKKRQRILAEKQVLIGRIIGEAKQQLKNMPQEAYFENIVKLAVKASQNGKGTILFSKADLDRLPENFADTLNAALVAGGKEGAALTVSSCSHTAASRRTAPSTHCLIPRTRCCRIRFRRFCSARFSGRFMNGKRSICLCGGPHPFQRALPAFRFSH